MEDVILLLCFSLSMATVNGSSTGAAWHAAATGRQLPGSALAMLCSNLTWSCRSWCFLGQHWVLQPRGSVGRVVTKPWSSPGSGVGFIRDYPFRHLVLHRPMLRSMWLLQAHYSAFPYHCRARFKPRSRPMDKRA